MKIVISPAKSLDFETPTPTSLFTEGIFYDEAEKLNGVLKKKTPKKLAALMSISDKLSELNWERNQHWQLPFTLENAKQAVYAFKGDVYIGLDAYSIPLDKIAQLQSKLRILSGQYGLLKPLDLIQPYRLEMGTKLKIGRKHNEPFVNLASKEYFKVIKPKLLKTPVITPVFKDYKDGKLKMIGFFAKKARGLMVRYIILNEIDTVEELKGFNFEGYAFDSNLSTESEFVFTR
jgi:cytoplasmic iron level regulating protein YaaA (DUF328/UPF0246 family)